MVFITKNNRQVLLRKITVNDIPGLCNYLHQLSDATKGRFGPHAFDDQAVTNFYADTALHTGYIAVDAGSNNIVGYCIIKTGWLTDDAPRLQTYGLKPLYGDCTFAPSVADTWQSQGLGNAMFNYMLNDVTERGFKRIILWAGVQASNPLAISFYTKHGFKTLGDFYNYNGGNYDMMLELPV